MTHNEFLASFTSKKLRKNAKKTIQRLLDEARFIMYHGQTSQIDDSFEADPPKSITAAEFWLWYEREYSDLSIELTTEKGILTKVTVRDCPYYFADKVQLYFEWEVFPNSNPTAIYLREQALSHAQAKGLTGDEFESLYSDWLDAVQGSGVTPTRDDLPNLIESINSHIEFAQ